MELLISVLFTFVYYSQMSLINLDKVSVASFQLVAQKITNFQLVKDEMSLRRIE